MPAEVNEVKLIKSNRNLLLQVIAAKGGFTSY